MALAAVVCLLFAVPGCNRKTAQPRLNAATANGAPLKPEPLPSPLFTFFDDLDEDVLRKRIETASAPLRIQPKPEKMQDDVYEMCRALLADGSEASDAGTYTREETGKLIDVCFTVDGKYIVTMSDQLNVWRIADKVRMRRHTVPIEGAKQLFVSKDSASATIVGQKRIVNLSLVDGKVTAEREVPEGISYASRASEAGHVAICTADKHLALISKDLKSRIDCPDTTLSSSRIAVHPTGKWVLGNHQNGMLRWHVRPSKVDVLGNMHFDPINAVPLSGPRFDRWVDSYSVHQFEGEKRTEVISEVPELSFVITPPVADAFACVKPNGFDWLLIAGRCKDAEDRDQLFVFDLVPEFESATYSVRISGAMPDEIYAGPQGDRFAVRRDTGLQVFLRSGWAERSGTLCITQLACIFKQQMFEQLELAFDYLRSHTRFPDGRTGEEKATALVTKIAQIWAASMEDPKCAELLASADDWLESESTLAVLSSAKRHIEIAWKARGGGFAKEVTQEGWGVFNKHLPLAQDDLTRLDVSQQLPACTFSMLMELALSTGQPAEVANVLLREYTRQYPLELDAHTTALCWSLPRWHGSDRQVGAYIAALADAYPEEMAELVYTRLAAYTSAFGDLGDDLGLDTQRIQAGIDAWLKDDRIPIEDVEAALWIAHVRLGDPVQLHRLADYHLTHFTFPKRSCYYYSAHINELLAARARVSHTPTRSTGQQETVEGERRDGQPSQ